MGDLRAGRGEGRGNNLVDEMLSHLEPPMPVVDFDDSSQVAAFYAGRSVFITGATGFIGKALIEKLIRSCPDIKRIYLLVREKRDKSVHERLRDLIDSAWFDRFRQLHGGDSSRVLNEKLCAISGDITQPMLGIAPDDMQRLSEDCSVVINSAATVRFSEPIEYAVQSNIYSVGQVVEFCNELANLQALIHISTVGSNIHKRDTIHEIFYEPPMRGDEIMRLVAELRETQSLIDLCGATGRLESIERADEQKCQLDVEEKSAGATSSQPAAATSAASDIVEEFTRAVLRRSNRPNTYSFTKAISENYLLEKTRARPERYLKDDKIQVAIVRPSIVCGAWREPLVGLVDNLNAATGVCMSMYTGAIQAWPGNGKLITDWVPVDMVANLTLSVGWFLSVGRQQRSRGPGESNEVKSDHGVYLFNFASGIRNPLVANEYLDWLRAIAYKYPSKYLVRLPYVAYILPGKLYDLYDLINHKLPAHLLYFIKSKLLGQRLDKRTNPIELYKRGLNMTNQLAPFTTNQWKWSDNNTLALYESLNGADKKVFPFDVALINMRQYIWSYIIGARIYALRDKPETLPAATRQLQQRRILNGLSMGMLIVIVYWFFLHGRPLCEYTLESLFI